MNEFNTMFDAGIAIICILHTRKQTQRGVNSTLSKVLGWSLNPVCCRCCVGGPGECQLSDVKSSVKFGGGRVDEAKGTE